MKKIMVLGHSHVFWLEQFIKQENLQTNFNVETVTVNFYGVGGMKIGHNEPEKNLLSDITLDAIRTNNPETICLMIGDNDVNLRTNANELGLRIIAAASTIMKKTSVKSVVIFQLLPRYLKDDRQNKNYDVTANAVNNFLLREAKQREDISFYYHDFARFRCENETRYGTARRLFCDVHLTPEGNWKLYKSTRAVMIKQGKEGRF